jgi:ubiquinone/menaquinone biosynthesis C-methylase UbiE
MSHRLKHWILVALVVVAAAGAAIGAGFVPYLPVVHGSTADEVARLAEWLELRPGMRVADVGAGDGGYAVELAERVGPSGHVYATEISQERLAEISQAAAVAGLSNITVIEGTVSRTNLPEACCDAIVTRFVYHHLDDAPAINADLVPRLRPGGRLLIIDFEPGGLLAWIGWPRASGHGTPRQTVMKEVTAAGLQALRGPESWRGRSYAALFRRP